MKVTIITVSFNSEETIENTIRSVLFQDYRDIEYIIVDGGSFDGTCEIIRKYEGKISHFISEKDDGIYDAMNKGIGISEGNIIGILNSDDCYANNHVISSVADRFEKTGSDALYGDLVYVEFKTNKVIRFWKTGEYKNGIFRYGWMPPHPTFFVKKNIYEKYGKYNTLLKNSADYEMMLRLIYKNNISVTYLPEVLVKMAIGGISNASLRNRIRANREDRLAWDLNNLSRPFFTTWLKPIRKIPQKFQFVKYGKHAADLLDKK